jgi:hypothetical protein
MVVTLGLAELLYHLDDSLKDLGAVLFDIAHKLLDLFIFRLVNHEFVALF